MHIHFDSQRNGWSHSQCLFCKKITKFALIAMHILFDSQRNGWSHSQCLFCKKKSKCLLFLSTLFYKWDIKLILHSKYLILFYHKGWEIVKQQLHLISSVQLGLDILCQTCFCFLLMLIFFCGIVLCQWETMASSSICLCVIYDRLKPDGLACWLPYLSLAMTHLHSHVWEDYSMV